MDVSTGLLDLIFESVQKSDRSGSNEYLFIDPAGKIDVWSTGMKVSLLSGLTYKVLAIVRGSDTNQTFKLSRIKVLGYFRFYEGIGKNFRNPDYNLQKYEKEEGDLQ